MGHRRQCRQPGGDRYGGALVDSMGWEWIFFVNVPVGVIGLILAAYLIPALPTTRIGSIGSASDCLVRECF